MFASAVGCGAKRDFKLEEVELMWDLEEQRVGLAFLIHSQPTSLTQMIRGLKQSITHTHTHATEKKKKVPSATNKIQRGRYCWKKVTLMTQIEDCEIAQRHWK